MTNAVSSLPESVDGVPNICGAEALIEQAMARPGPYYLPESRLAFGQARSAFAIALHMHQPLIPAGGNDPRTARVTGNLQYMMEHPNEGDNHNAPVFAECPAFQAVFHRGFRLKAGTPNGHAAPCATLFAAGLAILV